MHRKEEVLFHKNKSPVGLKMVNIQFQILVVVLTATLTDSAAVFVSRRNGKDKNGCGRDLTFPCKSLGYVLETKVTVINLDGGKDELSPLTYEVYKTFQLKRDIAMEGTGKVLPIILMPNHQGTFNRYLFYSSDNHTITVNRIRFYNVSLITVGISFSNIKLHSCVLEHCNDFIARENIMARKDLLNFEITNCKFINSKFNLLFADLRIFNSTIVRSSIHATDVVVVNISNCVFQNIPNVLLTCKLSPFSVVVISNTNFMNTLTLQNAITVSLCSRLYILYSSFEGFKYNTIRMDYVGLATVKRSIFKNNKGILGGALTLTRSRVVVTNSIFLNNTATYGGAIYFTDGTVSLLVENSKFISNTALVLGGSIYAIIEKSLSYSTIVLNNVTMYGNPIYPLSSGVLIYSTIPAFFQNVTMAVSKMLPEWPITDGFTCHDACLASLDHWTVNFTYVCPDNHYVVPVRYGKLKELSSLRCVRCKKNSYTMRQGKFQILHDRSRVLNKYAACLKCPSGGHCDNRITSRDNFWGYASTVQRIVAFLPCPPSYCCSHGKVKCVSYNTCNRYRMGILCGSCKTGYRVNFVDESCILKTGCQKHIFWLLYLFYAIIYTGILLYYKNVFLFILKHIRSFKKTKVLHESVMEPLLDGTEFDREDERNTAIISAVATQEDPCTTPNYHEEVGMIKNISGTKTILFFFYQIEVLLRINENDHQTKSVVGSVKKIISSVFNLQIISEPLSKLCPSKDLTKVGKEVVKISIIPTAMMFLILAFVTKKIYSACITRRREEGELANCQKDVHVKVKSCLIQLTLLGYTGISAFCLRMMNCVNINDTGHLYIQGDVVCYLWWQYLIMVFFSIWIVLFPLSTYLSEKMLTKDHITSSQFYFCFAFPPYAIYRYLKRKRIIPDFNSNQPYDGTKEKDQIIGLFQGPYRSKISNSQSIGRLLYCFDD
ncbi:uncharacterized protein LOC130649380 [Hydractinia symbiolongicarpus]|uniref:uncharacterized protein LOC130649380 n=1 Tax=Hydractinia symbiolongicarpus TaxID=13093 RepID=UPI0025513A21|nr:uncharacterized protein LOC130649380 [Hydractinia symbiolongicarpus]